MLSDNHYTLKCHHLRMAAADGEWQTQRRETYDRGNGATLLPYNLARRTVVLVQAVPLSGLCQRLRRPHDRSRRRPARQRLARRRGSAPRPRRRPAIASAKIEKVFEAFMSPGSVTEKLHFFVAEYEPTMQVGAGGGIADRRRGHRGAGTAHRRRARHDRRRPHRRRQDHHAAAICGAEYFPGEMRWHIPSSSRRRPEPRTAAISCDRAVGLQRAQHGICGLGPRLRKDDDA